MFLCIWGPMALSVPDSLWFEKSLSTVLTYPRIFFAGIYMIWALREELARQRLLRLSAWLLLFWVLDALMQAAVGYDLLGYDYPKRLNGVFGMDDWKLGLTLAMLAPIIWEYVYQRGSRWQLAVAWLGTIVVVLLASNRQSWIVFMIATLLWGTVYARRLGLRPVRLLLASGLVCLVAGIAAYQVNPKFAKRIDKSLVALDFSYRGLNAASSGRVHLWGNAVAVFANHPVNGAGVRSYRYAYAKYAEVDDPYLGHDGTGMIYAHQLILEVGAETGIIGLGGLLGFLGLLVWQGWRATDTSGLAWVAWVGAFAWFFPLNTHTALYSSYWAVLLGWLLAVSMSRAPFQAESG